MATSEAVSGRAGSGDEALLLLAKTFRRGAAAGACIALAQPDAVRPKPLVPNVPNGQGHVALPAASPSRAARVADWLSRAQMRPRGLSN